MSRKQQDPRIANVLARITDWEGKDDGAAEAGRFVGMLLERVDFEAMSIDELRRIVTAVMKEADDGLLEVFSDEADSERSVFLECTIGNEITEALQKCGVQNGFIAEQIAHKAIHDALAEDRKHKAERKPVAA